MYNNSQVSSWSIFLHSLQTRFASSQFNYPQGALFKLTKTSSIHNYQCQFEALSNRVTRNFLLSCFISGLKPQSRREVQAVQPFNLMHAIDLAKLQEEQFSEIDKLK